MDPITKYYKNLAEKLSSELDILESCLSLNEATDEQLIQEGMRRALKKGTEESLSKEAMRQGERKKRQEDLARRAGEAYDRASRTKGPFSAEALAYAGLQNKASASARKLPQEIEHLDVQLSSMNPELARRTSRKYMSQASLGDDPFPQRKMLEASDFKNETEYYKTLSEELKEYLNYLANVLYEETDAEIMNNTVDMRIKAYEMGGIPDSLIRVPVVIPRPQPQQTTPPSDSGRSQEKKNEKESLKTSPYLSPDPLPARKSRTERYA